jgi:hypothetical protein
MYLFTRPGAMGCTLLVARSPQGPKPLDYGCERHGWSRALSETDLQLYDILRRLPAECLHSFGGQECPPHTLVVGNHAQNFGGIGIADQH